MRYGDWFRSLDGSHEHRLPFLFSIVSRGLLEKIPHAHQLLAHNSQRLVSKLDLNLTLKHLANIPQTHATSDKTEIHDSYL